MALLYYLSRKQSHVFSAFHQHGDSVMAIKNSAIRPSLQRTRLMGRKCGSQLARGKAAEEFEFDPIQGAPSMEKLQLWTLR
jgi:hypothetical protein